jgi:REP element-mobilizing transposase RayT
MPNTYTQIYIHIVFAVRNREALINSVLKEMLYKYISGTIEKQNQKLYIINGMPDHVHILVSLNGSLSVANLVKEIKEHSTKYINEQNVLKAKFYWQEGYGAFSVSQSALKNVIDYIKNQEHHHLKTNFIDEYKSFLKAYNIEFNEKYIFTEIE